MKQNVKQTIILPVELFNYIKKQAKSRKMTVSAYVRHVLSSSRHGEYIEIADEETEKAIAEAMDDVKHGRYVTVEPGDKKALRKVLWGE